MITCIIIGASLFFLVKKLDEDGICMIKGRELTDEEIYVASMTEFFEQALQFKEFHRAKMEGCRFKEWKCELWIGPALNQKQIVQLIDESVEFDTKMFISKFQLSDLNNINEISNKTKLLPNNNGFTIVSTITGIRIYAQDCCSVYTYRKPTVPDNIDKFAIDNINIEDRVDGKRFLKVDGYYPSDVYSRKSDPNYSLLEARKAMTDNNEIATHFLPVSACGKLKFNNFAYATDMPNPYDNR